MKACWYEKTGPARDVLVIGEMPTPEPGPGEVRVKIAVSAVNPSDTKGRSGWRGRPIGFPRVVPHQDGAGTIDKVGPDIDAGRVGERVWVYMAQRSRPFGTAAEYTAVQSERAVKLPDNASFEEGACLGIPAMTAHRCLYADDDIGGKAILVQGGAGAVGFYAVQLAKLGGARVVATVGRPETASRAREIGADAVVDYTRENVVARVAALFNNAAPLDRVIEVAFGKNLQTDVALLKSGGVIATYSSDAVPDPVVPFTPMLMKDLTVHFVLIYEIPQSARDHAARDINRLIAAGKLKHQIAEVFPLARIAEAHERMEEGRVVGKLLVRLG
ncbi:MAG: NADPH:quinone reductase [Alphaproteobacteria bacterium]|nr:NADPH:quinone reductase [Alphaproteobacteria bacterium]